MKQRDFEGLTIEESRDISQRIVNTIIIFVLLLTAALCVSLLWPVSANASEPLHFNVGEENHGNVRAYVDRNGRIYDSYTNRTLDQLDFFSTAEINRRTAVQNSVNDAFRANVVSLDGRLTGLANRYTAFEQDVDHRFGALDKKLSAGIAGSYAMNNIPTPPNNGLNLGGGVGLFGGQTAIALGAMGHTEKLYLKGGATLTQQGDLGGGFGAGWSFKFR